jgi:hypothetical protein
VRPVMKKPVQFTKWHGGLLSGTPDGLNWSVLFNSDANAKGKEFASLIDPLLHEAADASRTGPKLTCSQSPNQERFRSMTPTQRTSRITAAGALEHLEATAKGCSSSKTL